MGHCISVYLINKSELRNEKIDTVLVNTKTDKLVWTDLGHNILAIPFVENIRDFGKDKTVAKITTDYFGGGGEQSAKLFVNNKKTVDMDDQYSKLSPINEVLKMLGVVRTSGMDEFDTVGLGNYRSNRDFNGVEKTI